MPRSASTMLPLIALFATACTGSSGPPVESAPEADGTTTEPEAEASTAEQPSADTPSEGVAADGASNAKSTCGATVTSTLPGVTVRFVDQPCTLTVDQAKNHSFPWELVVSEAPGKLEHTVLHHCDGLRESGFHPREKLHGNEQSYEILDAGRCRYPELKSSPTVGTYPESFAWDGVNWTGPSDFGNPKGKPFPAGDYTFSLELRGTLANGDAWEILGDMPFSITGVAATAPKRGEGPGPGAPEPVTTEPPAPVKPVIREPLNREHEPPSPG